MKYIFFDLDGTLTDSGPGILAAVRYSLDKLGAPCPEEATLRKFVGPPLVWSYRHFCGMSPEGADEAVAAYREYYNITGIYQNAVYDGVPNLLQRLRQAGCQLILATSKPEHLAVRVLEHFDLKKWFTVVAGADDSVGRREKDAVIREALRRLGLASGAGCAMVGDRHYDVRGGHAFGMIALGVTYGYGDREELREAGADLLADSPAEAADLLLARD